MAFPGTQAVAGHSRAGARSIASAEGAQVSSTEAVTLDDIGRPRPSRRPSPSTPRRDVGGVVGAARRRRRAEGREPAAHRCVQDPRGDEQGRLARRSAAAHGVTAGSAGNHAQALAFAARHFGVPCDIFVPAGAPITKIEACRAYGADGRRGRRVARRGVRRRPGPGRRARAWPSATRSTTRRRRRPGHARTSSWSTTSPTSPASSSRSAAAGWPPAWRSPSSRSLPQPCG